MKPPLDKLVASHVLLHLQIALAFTDSFNTALKSLYKELEDAYERDMDRKADL